MALKIFDKLKPQGNYPAVDAADVNMGENFGNMRLDAVMVEAGEALAAMGEAMNYVPIIPTAEAGKVVAVKEVDENGKPTAWETVEQGNADAVSVVTFDLAALGLPAMNADTGEVVTLETDTTEIATALESSFVQFVFQFNYRGLAFSNVIVTVPPNCGYGVTGLGGNTVFFSIVVSDGTITASAKLFSAWHGLPEVTTTDDGKVLRVVDGAWAAVEEEATEDELPAITTEDNGKFLRVVDGAWGAVSLDSAEEASF